VFFSQNSGKKTSSFIKQKTASSSACDKHCPAFQMLSYVAKLGEDDILIAMETDITALTWAWMPLCCHLLGHVTKQSEDDGEAETSHAAAAAASIDSRAMILTPMVTGNLYSCPGGALYTVHWNKD
jgi:hypothetical protein